MTRLSSTPSTFHLALGFLLSESGMMVWGVFSSASINSLLLWWVMSRGADGRVAADAAGVIDVRVGVDHVANGLGGDELVRFGDDRDGTSVVHGSFDDGDEILEFDDEAAIVLAGEPLETVTEFLGHDGERRRGRGVAHALGNGKIGGNVGLGFGDKELDVEALVARERRSVNGFDDVGGELETTAEIAVVVDRYGRHARRRTWGDPSRSRLWQPCCRHRCSR